MPKFEIFGQLCNMVMKSYEYWATFNWLKDKLVKLSITKLSFNL